jgi:hypothetical protein
VDIPDPGGDGVVTTKEIPKRELRDQLPQFLIRPVQSDGYNKRNPKKGIESRLRSLPRA